MSVNRSDLVYICPQCGAGAFGDYPHGNDGTPCPLAVAREAEYVEKLRAERKAAEAAKAMYEEQRVYYERAQFPMLDQSEYARKATRFLEKMTGDEEEGE